MEAHGAAATAAEAEKGGEDVDAAEQATDAICASVAAADVDPEELAKTQGAARRAWAAARPKKYPTSCLSPESAFAKGCYGSSKYSSTSSRPTYNAKGHTDIELQLGELSINEL